MRRVLVVVLVFVSTAVAGPARASQLTFAPSADAALSAGRPGSNYGGSAELQADASPIERSLLRFDVTGVGAGTVTSAKLRLLNINDSPAGGDFSRLADTPSWSEETVTYNTAPATDGTPVATLGAVAQGRWYEVDLTALVTGDGTFEVGLSSTSSNGAGYASREATAANRPQLVVTFEPPPTGPTPPADPTPPAVTVSSPSAGASVSGTVPVQASATDDGGVTSVEFFVDGVAAVTDAAAPFNFDWDTTTVADGSHSLTAKAYDADGMTATSPAVSVTVANAAPPPPPPDLPTLTFGSHADAYVRKDKPTTNYGSGSSLETDASPLTRTLLRFIVAGVDGRRVLSAKLRLFNVNDAPHGGTFSRLAATPVWTESGVTWNTAPPVTGSPVATLGRAARSRWYEIDVLPIVSRDGIVDIGITTTSSDGVGYASKEAASAETRPQLVLTLDPVPPDLTIPTVEITAPAEGDIVSRTVPVTAAAADDEGVTAVAFSVDGVTVATDDTEPFVFDWDTTTVANGVHELHARASDADGKSGASAPVAVTVSNLATGTSPDGVITFGAAGDWGANSTTAASLRKLDASGADFFLLVGDLDYGEVSSPAAWCSYVTSRLPTLGPRFPIELISGNHEDDRIDQHAACLPDRLDAQLRPTSTFPTEYSIDYPAAAPLVRSVMISPNLVIDNVAYNYTAGSTRYNWVAATIDDARARGIPWIVVGMHKNCWTSGSTSSCSVGMDLMNLLIAKRVDFVIQGHQHTYKRGKQLALNGGSCNEMTGSFNAACVVDDGSDASYAKGAGTIILINGSFGKGGSSSSGGYFARAGGGNGFTKFTMTATRVDAEFVNSTSSFTDTYSVVG